MHPYGDVPAPGTFWGWGHPPPPPPPPRTRPAGQHHHSPSADTAMMMGHMVAVPSRRQSSHVNDGSDAGSLMGHTMERAPSSQFEQAAAYAAHECLAVDPSLGPAITDCLHRLEIKMMMEINRIEIEWQSNQRALSTDVGKWRKEREVAWKHVGELKEQNRLLRLKLYELEVQNGHLNRHIYHLQRDGDGVAPETGKPQLSAPLSSRGSLDHPGQGLGAPQGTGGLDPGVDGTTHVHIPPHGNNALLVGVLGGESKMQKLPRLPGSADIW